YEPARPRPSAPALLARVHAPDRPRATGGRRLMPEKEIRVPTPDGEMTAFVVRPDGEAPFPVGVLYMDAPGYREQVKENARRFAEGGFYVVAPDLFYRHGDGLTFDFSKP